LARIKLQAPDRSFSAKCLFFLKRPDKLRIVILDFFNQPALFLVAGNDAGLTMFTPSTNICYGGKATPENMDRAFGIPLSARDILDAVLGPAPETVPADTAFSVDQQDSLYRVSLISAEQRQTLLTEPGRDLLRQYTKAVRNEPLFTCTYAEHKTIDGLLIPSKREIRLPAHDTALSITFTNQSTKQLQAELFTFTPPATAQLLPLARILQPR
ncbi:MAG: DUF4292 domain-containing protein, partial [Deltaproteobacteria bacterium]|nr:DUF4292 domain-containing protein [Deltaproteobacteria bacterium]